MKEQLEDLFESGQIELAIMTGLNIVSTDELAEM